MDGIKTSQRPWSDAASKAGNSLVEWAFINS